MQITIIIVSTIVLFYILDDHFIKGSSKKSDNTTILHRNRRYRSRSKPKINTASITTTQIADGHAHKSTVIPPQNDQSQKLKLKKLVKKKKSHQRKTKKNKNKRSKKRSRKQTRSKRTLQRTPMDFKMSHNFPIIVKDYGCKFYLNQKSKPNQCSFSSFEKRRGPIFFRSGHLCIFRYDDSELEYEAFGRFCETFDGIAEFKHDCNLKNYRPSIYQSLSRCKPNWDYKYNTKNGEMELKLNNHDTNLPNGECLQKFQGYVKDGNFKLRRLVSCASITMDDIQSHNCFTWGGYRNLHRCHDQPNMLQNFPKKPSISITIVKSSNHNVASSKQQQQQHRSRMSNPNPSFQKQQHNEANNYHYFPIVVMSNDGRCGIYEYYKPARGSDKCAAYINSHKTTFVRSDNTCTFWYQNFAYEAFEGYCDTSQGHAGFSSDCRKFVSWQGGEQNSWHCKSTWDNNKHGSYSKTAFTITFQNEREIPRGECLVKFLTPDGGQRNVQRMVSCANIVRSIGYQGSNGECLLVADGAIGRCENYQQIINSAYKFKNPRDLVEAIKRVLSKPRLTFETTKKPFQDKVGILKLPFCEIPGRYFVKILEKPCSGKGCEVIYRNEANKLIKENQIRDREFGLTVTLFTIEHDGSWTGANRCSSHEKCTYCPKEIGQQITKINKLVKRISAKVDLKNLQ